MPSNVNFNNVLSHVKSTQNEFEILLSNLRIYCKAIKNGWMELHQHYAQKGSKGRASKVGHMIGHIGHISLLLKIIKLGIIITIIISFVLTKCFSLSSAHTCSTSGPSQVFPSASTHYHECII